MDTLDKGELIQKEKEGLYNIQRKISLYLVIVCVVFIMLFIYVLINENGNYVQILTHNCLDLRKISQ